jgi:hypothetical protein
MWPQECAAFATGHIVETAVEGVVLDGRAAAAFFAPGFCELAMHVDEPSGAGALVKIVDVLRAEEETVTEAGLEIG